jgi:hypothetical protein
LWTINDRIIAQARAFKSRIYAGALDCRLVSLKRSTNSLVVVTEEATINVACLTKGRFGLRTLLWASDIVVTAEPSIEDALARRSWNAVLTAAEFTEIAPKLIALAHIAEFPQTWLSWRAKLGTRDYILDAVEEPILASAGNVWVSTAFSTRAAQLAIGTDLGWIQVTVFIVNGFVYGAIPGATVLSLYSGGHEK